jgi:hypothetical protein
LQVIDELIALAPDLSASAQRGEELGMAPEELAFYDALAENGSARDLMERETLRTLAQLLVKTIRSTVTADWTQKESVRAKLRIEVRKLLARYGYPPDLQKAAVDLSSNRLTPLPSTGRRGLVISVVSRDLPLAGRARSTVLGLARIRGEPFRSFLAPFRPQEDSPATPRRANVCL